MVQGKNWVRNEMFKEGNQTVQGGYWVRNEMCKEGK